MTIGILQAFGIGVSLAALSLQLPTQAPPAAAGSQPATKTPATGTGHKVAKAAKCVAWYYPAPATFHKASGVTETFYLAGYAPVLAQYAGHPEWVHLSDTVTGSANPWNVTSVTWDGHDWLKIEATHGTVTGGGDPTPGPDPAPAPAPTPDPTPAPDAPKPPTPDPDPAPAPDVPKPASATVRILRTGRIVAPASGPVGGTILVGLDPIGGATCVNVTFNCTYVD